MIEEIPEFELFLKNTKTKEVIDQYNEAKAFILANALEVDKQYYDFFRFKQTLDIEKIEDIPGMS